MNYHGFFARVGAPVKADLIEELLRNKLAALCVYLWRETYKPVLLLGGLNAVLSGPWLCLFSMSHSADTESDGMSHELERDW